MLGCRHYGLESTQGLHGHVTDLVVLVKGDTRDASASLKARPACAARRAPQSLPPSPHMPITIPDRWYIPTTSAYTAFVVAVVQV